MKAKKQRFEIDFFEFSFLVEACLPESPIARAVFWQRVIDKHFYEMTPNERTKLFHWIQLNYGFDRKKPDCELFYLRFDPDNQYLVVTDFEGKVENHECFKMGDRYYTSSNRSIQEQYITSITKTTTNELGN